MSQRQRRIDELIAARRRLDIQIARLGGALVSDLPTSPPVQQMSLERAADIARKAVHGGSTHAEVGRLLGIPVESVASLIAPRREVA